MSGPLCDIYVMAPRRAADLAFDFLDRFLPEHKAEWDPTDPADVLGVSRHATVAEILTYLESHPTSHYTLYWSNLRSAGPSFAILAFNSDGSLVLGLSCKEAENLARRFLADLEEFAGGSRGYWGVEEAPAGSRAEFGQRLMSNDR